MRCQPFAIAIPGLPPDRVAAALASLVADGVRRFPDRASLGIGPLEGTVEGSRFRLVGEMARAQGWRSGAARSYRLRLDGAIRATVDGSELNGVACTMSIRRVAIAAAIVFPALGLLVALGGPREGGVVAGLVLGTAPLVVGLPWLRHGSEGAMDDLPALLAFVREAIEWRAPDRER